MPPPLISLTCSSCSTVLAISTNAFHTFHNPQDQAYIAASSSSQPTSSSRAASITLPQQQHYAHHQPAPTEQSPNGNAHKDDESKFFLTPSHTKKFSPCALLPLTRTWQPQPPHWNLAFTAKTAANRGDTVCMIRRLKCANCAACVGVQSKMQVQVQMRGDTSTPQRRRRRRKGVQVRRSKGKGRGVGEGGVEVVDKPVVKWMFEQGMVCGRSVLTQREVGLRVVEGSEMEEGMEDVEEGKNGDRVAGRVKVKVEKAGDEDESEGEDEWMAEHVGEEQGGEQVESGALARHEPMPAWEPIMRGDSVSTSSETGDDDAGEGQLQQHEADIDTPPTTPPSSRSTHSHLKDTDIRALLDDFNEEIRSLKKELVDVKAASSFHAMQVQKIPVLDLHVEALKMNMRDNAWLKEELKMEIREREKLQSDYVDLKMQLNSEVAARRRLEKEVEAMDDVVQDLAGPHDVLVRNEISELDMMVRLNKEHGERQRHALEAQVGDYKNQVSILKVQHDASMEELRSQTDEVSVENAQLESQLSDLRDTHGFITVDQGGQIDGLREDLTRLKTAMMGPHSVLEQVGDMKRAHGDAIKRLKEDVQSQILQATEQTEAGLSTTKARLQAQAKMQETQLRQRLLLLDSDVCRINNRLGETEALRHELQAIRERVDDLDKPGEGQSVTQTEVTTRPAPFTWNYGITMPEFKPVSRFPSLEVLASPATGATDRRSMAPKAESSNHDNVLPTIEVAMKSEEVADQSPPDIGSSLALRGNLLAATDEDGQATTVQPVPNDQYLQAIARAYTALPETMHKGRTGTKRSYTAMRDGSYDDVGTPFDSNLTGRRRGTTQPRYAFKRGRRTNQSEMRLTRPTLKAGSQVVTAVQVPQRATSLLQ